MSHRSGVPAASPPFSPGQESVLTVDESTHQNDIALANALSNDLQIFQIVDEDIAEGWNTKPPKIIGNYIFGRELGSGSYSKVKEVFHRDKGIKRAIKIIKDKKISKIPQGIGNIEREFSILSKLNHANVIRLVEAFRVDSRCKTYMVFEYCVATIQMLLDNAVFHRMIEYQAQFYFRQMVAGLSYLHRIGVIHKDIKPDNLLVTEDNVLKIADFGVAEQLANPDDDSITVSMGTPALQAPEVVDGEAKSFHGKCADIWSAGVTLYRVVIGRYPFDGAVLMKLFDNIMSSPVAFPDELPLSNSFVELIKGMLHKSPLQRWTTDKIESCEWMSLAHPLSDSEIVPLPKSDNTYFKDLIAEINEAPDEVQIETACVPFEGRYPVSVASRGLLTPLTGNIPGRDVALSDPDLGPLDGAYDDHPLIGSGGGDPRSRSPDAQPRLDSRVTRKKKPNVFLQCFRLTDHGASD